MLAYLWRFPFRQVCATMQHMSSQEIPNPEDQPTMSLYPETARAMNMGRSAIYDACHRGDLPFPVLKCGGKFRVPTAALRRVLELDGPVASRAS